MKVKHNHFRDYATESKLFIHRILIAFIMIVLCSGILIANLYHLQITKFEDYRTQSNENRIKIIPISPNRGIIYDRQGIPLAINQTIYQLEVIPEKINNLQQTINDLKLMINLNDNDIYNFKKENKRIRKFSSLPIKKNLTEEQKARFSVNQFLFPEVRMKGYQSRFYPHGSTAAHVIGYVSKINTQDIQRLNKEGILSHYAATNNIGKLGIERYYENFLHGKIGYEKVEVNNHCQVIRKLYKKLPQSGKDIYLTLDIKLQKYIETLLIGSRSAVVVSDPRDGGILALISNPSYDPNMFVNSISKQDYNNLLKDKNRPLINRVTQGIYPPASTVKPYISVSALTLGVINKNSSLFDPGWWKLPGSEKYYRDWKRWGHGQINVTKALEESSDTFFYQVVYDMGIDRLSEWMKKFGYGQRTGIDLLEENTGIMPTRNWKKNRFNKSWYRGDTISIGIGQGYWSSTPIQMSKALMILINNGIVRIPHLLFSIRDNRKLIPYDNSYSMQIGDPNSDFWEVAKNGMYGVANRSNGTAYINFIDAPYKVAAKSGTAQVYSLKYNETYNTHKLSERLHDHKLMIAFAPYDKPTVSIVVILENGGIGPSVGTITRKILDYVLLDNQTKSSSISPFLSSY